MLEFSLPTVRVVNPSDASSYVTINRSDFHAGHELWPVQAHGFVPLPGPFDAGRLDPAERDLAASLMMRMVAFKRRLTGEPFEMLPPHERVVILREVAAEFDDAENDGVRASAGLGGAWEFNPPADMERAMQDDALAIAKGPRGLYYVMRGEDRVSKGFADHYDADLERERLQGASA